ncbi:MAG: ABC transporter ATP-binding protein [Phycisphaerae bacterium]|nr:ABC transporter ATP-binding protein [Phycisphaerae bacterium]
MIHIEHVTKRFGRAAAVDDATLDLGAGESLALWGANGAGKTTLIRCVLGLLGFRGTIRVGGHDVRRDGKAARLLIGYVPQELGFYDDLTVCEAVAFFSRLKGLPHTDTDRTLATVGLLGHERKRIRELSGGMKQRLALAIALLGDPPVLVLDEVTASLDAVGREEFVNLLAGLSGTGRTLLFASHRIEEVAALSGRVAVLEAGRITRVVPCADFVAETDRGTVLHLFLAPSVRDQAMQSLRVGGFSPHLNGVGILVPVTPERKAAPFRLLAEARIPVDDFEIVSATHARRVAHVPHSASSSPGGNAVPHLAATEVSS